jgi:stearoyl-CoA desaturase (delta-9 desaturase)
MGTTIGYHRLLSHRAFKCPKAVEYFFVLGGYLAFEGAPIWWAASHRAHHKYTDTPLDPHSPRYGLKHAYFGWITKQDYAPHVAPERLCPDLMSDPIYGLLERQWIVFAVGFLFRAVLWLIFGWEVALGSLVAGLAGLQIPLLLNVVCHIPRFGYKNYARDDDSVNVWWVALLAMGEGWHNNHHAFPGSARTGMQPHEWDVSWLMIKFLKSVGLVSEVHEASPTGEARPASEPSNLPAN